MAKKFSIGRTFSSIGGFFRGIVGECKKVTWPTMQATVKDSLVVLVACLVIGAFIWVFDYGFGNLVDWFLKLGS